MPNKNLSESAKLIDMYLEKKLINSMPFTYEFMVAVHFTSFALLGLRILVKGFAGLTQWFAVLTVGKSYVCMA